MSSSRAPSNDGSRSFTRNLLASQPSVPSTTVAANIQRRAWRTSPAETETSARKPSTAPVAVYRWGSQIMEEQGSDPSLPNVHRGAFREQVRAAVERLHRLARG